MRKAVKDTFIDQITSMEMQLMGKTGAEAAETAYTQSFSVLKTAIAKLKKTLDKLDTCALEDMRGIAKECEADSLAIGEALAGFSKQYCRLIHAYAK